MLNILGLRRKLKKSATQNWKYRTQFQAKRFQELLMKARTIPFWESRLQNCNSIKDLSSVPILTKSILMENFDAILKSSGISQKSVMDFFSSSSSAQSVKTNLFALRTSGTSGQVTCLVIDKADAERMLASSIVFGTVPSNFKTMTNAFVGKKMKVVSIILENGHFPGTFYSHLMRKFVKVMSIVAESSIIDIGQPIHDIISQLNKASADVWVTYPSMLRVLARQAQDGKLTVKPSHLISTSEPLDSHTLQIAKEYFTNNTHNVYGSGECPFIATSCKMKELHIRPETCIVENVDENNNPVPDGTTGHHVLVTNLNAHTLPIIRFYLDDAITIDTRKCSCGDSSPIIKKIDGRTDDIFWLKNKQQEIVPIHPCAFEPPLINDFRIEEYQITHDVQNHIIVRVASKHNVENELPNIFHQHVCHLKLDDILDVEFRFCNEIPRQASGKFRRFVSLVASS